MIKHQPVTLGTLHYRTVTRALPRFIGLWGSGLENRIFRVFSVGTQSVV
jgi:hypothetical protein